MNLNRIAVAFAALTLSTPTALAWQYSDGSDPLDDTTFAAIAESTADQRYAILFKCWENKPDQILTILMTNETFDSAANYPATVDVQLRFDKGDVRTIPMVPRSTDGKLSFREVQIPSLDWLTYVNELGGANKQMVLGVSGNILVFPASGSSKAVEKFKTTCKLP